MTTLKLSIYAMAIGLCVFTGVLAWRSQFPNRAFFTFLGVLTTMLACDWLMAHPASPLKNLWLLGIMASSFLVAPCALWLAKATGLTAKPLQVGRHALLAVGGWLLLLPLATAIHWGTEFAKPGNPTSAHYAFFIHSTMLLSVALFLAQTWLVLGTCMAYLRERNAQNHALFSVCEDSGLNTLRLLVLIVMANAAIAIVRVLYCALLDEIQVYLSLSIVLGQLTMVMFLAMSFIHQQVAPSGTRTDQLRAQLFKPAPATPQDKPMPIAANSAREPYTPSAGKYNKSSLAPERQSQILAAINQAMMVDRLFTQPGLSLSELCTHIDESAHSVSQAISQSEHRNFYELVNRHRVTMATRLLREQPTATVLDIGFSCGFNSKSAFNSAFKQYQGLTPSQYRKQHLVSSPTSEQANTAPMITAP